MKNGLVKLIGFPATVLHGDPAVFDRWLWLRKHLIRGPVRTLDAGCGSGAFTFYAAKAGNSAVGISFDAPSNDAAAERAKLLGLSNASFIIHDLRALDAAAGSLGMFDQVICCETIEHIKGDRKFLHDLALVTKPGARLLLTTPYTFYRRLPGDSVSEVEDGRHMRWGYTHEEMRTLLAENGFEVVAAEYVTGFVSQQLIRLGRHLGRVHPLVAWGIVLPLRLLTVLDPLLTPLLRYPWLSIAVVAVRK